MQFFHSLFNLFLFKRSSTKKASTVRCLSYQRLPPSDLNTNKQQNSPRLISANFQSACPRC